MNEVLTWAATAVALGTAAGAVVGVVRNRTPGPYLILAVGLLELVLLVVTVTGIVQLAATDRDVQGPALIGYLLSILIIPPAAVLWSFVERTRFGAAVIVIGCLAVPVMIERVNQIWAAGSA